MTGKIRYATVFNLCKFIQKKLEFITSISLFKYFRLIITLRGHMRKFLATLGCMLSLMANFGHAVDCEYNDLLIFGNSLSDTGNAFLLSPLVTTPPGGGPIPPSPPYFNGRFSDGPIWVDYTQAALEIDVQNFAVGGALSNGTNIYDPVYQMGGLFQQLGRFQAADGHINDDQTVILEIGSNDFLNILKGVPTPAAFTLTTLQALGDIGAVLPQLQDLGAERTVVWNLPPLGQTPLFRNPTITTILGTAPLGPIYDQVVSRYNEQLLSVVKSRNLVAEDHDTVFYFDANNTFLHIRDDLAAQGFNVFETNYLSQLGLNPPVVIPIQPYNPNTAFFDQVHPSTIVWNLFAKEFSAYLDTIDQSHRSISAQQDAIAVDYRAFRYLLDNHFRTLHRQFYVCPSTCDDCCEPSCYQVYVDGLAKWGKTKNGCGISGFKYDTQLAGIGFDYFLNNCLTAGVSFTAQRNKAKLEHNNDELLLNEYIPTFYATYTDPCFYADFDISYRYLYFKDITRHIPFICRTLKTHATGWGLSTGLQGGYLYNCDCITTGPVVGVNYNTALIHAYNEKGRRYPSLRVRGQHQNNCFLKAGWQMFWNQCDCGISPHAEVDYYYDFLHHRRKIIANFRHAKDGAQIRHKVQNGRERNFLTYNVGIDFGVWESITGNISYQGETTFHHYNNAVIAELDSKF